MLGLLIIFLAFMAGLLCGYYIRRHHLHIKSGFEKSPYSLKITYHGHNSSGEPIKYYIILENGSIYAYNRSGDYMLYSTKAEAVSVINEMEEIEGYTISKFN